jgi:hypothetical protein
MKVKVCVTDRNIANGLVGDPCLCPVANALRGAGFADVDVNHTWMDFCDTGSDVTYRAWLPMEATNRIKQFDDHNGMEPFEFEVEAIEQ